jgi:hypothetical protein
MPLQARRPKKGNIMKARTAMGTYGVEEVELMVGGAPLTKGDGATGAFVDVGPATLFAECRALDARKRELATKLLIEPWGRRHGGES